jgi:hypothetical protein
MLDGLPVWKSYCHHIFTSYLNPLKSRSPQRSTSTQLLPIFSLFLDKKPQKAAAVYYMLSVIRTVEIVHYEIKNFLKFFCTLV